MSGSASPRKDIGGVDQRIIALGVARMADAVANSFLIADNGSATRGPRGELRKAAEAA